MKRILKVIYFYVLIISIAFSLVNSTFASSSQLIVNEYKEEHLNQDELHLKESELEKKLYTNSLILIEKNTGDVLYEKNSHVRLYPASTTKMLTAILVFENCSLDEVATVSKAAIDAVPESYTTADLKAGEEFTVKDLLYALLIPSANDAANVLAEHISGSIPAFADLMNEKANALGLTSSHFTNPSRNSR